MTQQSSTLFQDAANKISRNPLALGSFVVIVFYILMALLAHMGIIAADYALTNNDLTYVSPGGEYLFGTDLFGRPVLSRAIHGSKTALAVGFFATSIAVIIGVFLGSLAGYFGGLVDDFIIWLYTTVDSIPYILLLSAFAFALGQGLTNV